MRRLTICLTMLWTFCVQGQHIWQAPHINQRPQNEKWSNIQTSRQGLDQNRLTELLNDLGSTTQALQLPMPDGTMKSFVLHEASILAPGLQAKFPEIRTYKGSNKSGETIRIDVNSKGFHGIAFTREGTVYIDPEEVGSSNYVSYYRQDYKNQKETPVFEETPVEKSAVSILTNHKKPAFSQLTVERSHGSQMRSYRIAIAADNTYSGFHGGTVADALAAIVTTMNRITGIYENELAITFVIVENNDQIIFTDAATDPYEGLSLSGTLVQNQTTLDEVIGSANYDIGHVFVTGIGGLAFPGVVCDNQFKARGTTGTDEPIGDPFVVDFVAHEIGHQFGANHTFNGTVGSCAGDDRNPSTAYEPGSGSTIMAYAGICGGHNIQNNSDAYFHAASLDEILTFSTESTGNSCAVITSTGNTPPEVTTPTGGFTIPINTPFSLTASGSDADGDELTYAWEQYDLGTGGSPNEPGSTSPLFRSFSPTSSPTRYFPRLENILAGNTVIGEMLPANTRGMNFRVTVRDNNPAGGGTNEADITFNATEDAGPFLVTSQTESVTHPGGSVLLIEWEVADTDKAPVNVSDVRILLSTDGGQSFEEVLSESTPNDGAEFVVLPNINASEARIMVEALGNVFFNISRSSFEIVQDDEPGFSLLVTEVPGVSCSNTLGFTVQALGVNGFTEEIALTFSSENNDIEVTSNLSTLSPGESITLNVENEGGPGEKSLSLQGVSGDLQREVSFPFSFLSPPLEAPLDLLPAEESTRVDLDTDFSWSSVADATSYNFMLATDQSFSNVIVESLNQVSTSFSLTEDLQNNTNYFWKVEAVNDCGPGPATQQKFITTFLESVDVAANDLPVAILDIQTVTSEIEITESLTIADVNVENLDISHSFVRDLTITLTSPSGTTVTLFQQECGGNNNIMINYDDEASLRTPCPPNDEGSYQPIGSLADFKGEDALGTWTLSVSDAADQDEGTINGWGLALQIEGEAISLFASSPVLDEVDLNWNDLSNDAGYVIEQAIEEGDFAQIAEIATNTTIFKVTGLQPATEYRYRVRGVLSTGFSEYSNVAPVTTLPEVPEAPSDLSGSFSDNGGFLLNWVDNSEREEGFLIERALDDDEFEELTRVGVNVTSFRDNDTERGLNHFYRVSAFNDSGNSSPTDVLTLLLLSSETLDRTMIFPNPTQRAITVSATLTRKFEKLTIYDLQGSILVRSSLDKGVDMNFDLGHLNPGLYFIQLEDGENNKQILKLVKTR